MKSFQSSNIEYDIYCELFVIPLIHIPVIFFYSYLLSVFFFLTWVCTKSESEVVQLCLTLCDPMDYTVHWNSPGQNVGVGSLSLLQGIFPTQGLNPGLPHYGRILYQLSHKGSPGILEWVAYPFSSRSSWPRNWTGVTCIAGGFFTNWTIKEAPEYVLDFVKRFFPTSTFISWKLITLQYCSGFCHTFGMGNTCKSMADSCQTLFILKLIVWVFPFFC